MRNENHSISAEYSIRQLNDLDEFKKCGDVWDSIAGNQDSYIPFLCFDWFKIWLENFLKDNKLSILLLYNGPKLITIAPFLINEGKFRGIKVKKLELIGNVYSPFRYFVFSELNDEERIKNLSFIFQFLSKNYRNWDIIDLSGIPEEKNYFDTLIAGTIQGGLKYTDFVCYGDWYLDEIEYSGDEYFNRLPEKIRKDVSYCKRRLQKMGKYEFKLIRNGDEIDHYMDLYYEVYSKSWQEKKVSGQGFIAIWRRWL